jgi:hypothetical protein
LSELHVKPVSVTLSAPVWNLLPLPGTSLMVIEQRDDVKRVASFSLFNFQLQQFLWRDVVAAEKWWLNLTRVTPDHVELKVFDNTENPDKTSLIFLSLKDGSLVHPTSEQMTWSHTNEALHPFQYLDGEPDFETVQSFLKSKLGVTSRLGVEYLEYENYILISYYAGNPAAFVNRLAIFNHQGECLYDEEIGMNLRGIGINTFFITSSYLFFVKNRSELVTFRIV